jgi:hypothetical protein
MLASIYPVIRGEHREVKAETNLSAPGGPFDSPAAITGRMLERLTDDELNEMGRHEVLFEGEVYTVGRLHADGAFELRKTNETAHVSFMVER